MKQFRCGDLVPGCSAEFRSKEEADLLAGVDEHARRDDGMTSIPEGLLDQVHAHIYEAPAA